MTNKKIKIGDIVRFIDRDETWDSVRALVVDNDRVKFAKSIGEDELLLSYRDQYGGRYQVVKRSSVALVAADDDQEHVRNDSDPLDVCPFCGGPMNPGNQHGMCNGCRRDRQGYADDWR